MFNLSNKKYLNCTRDQAIQQGYDLANYDIGNYYRTELDDRETAIKYYQLAACAGSKAAQKVLNQLYRTYKCDNL